MKVESANVLCFHLNLLSATGRSSPRSEVSTVGHNDPKGLFPL